MRVGLVEDDQARVGEHRAGEAQPLALAAGQRRPAVAEPGRVALAQPQDHLVRAGEPRRRDHGRRVRRLGHPGDVLGDRAGEQHRVLRQEADVAAQLARAVVVQAGAVEPHRALGRDGDAGQQPAQGALARAGRPDHRQAIAGLELEAHAAQQLAAAFGAYRGVLDRQPPERGRQADAGRRRRAGGQQVAHAPPAVAGAAHGLPGADHLLDRGQRLAGQDRAGEHGARGELAPEHQPGAQAQEADLDGQPQRAGHAQDHAAALGGGLLLPAARAGAAG